MRVWRSIASYWRSIRVGLLDSDPTTQARLDCADDHEKASGLLLRTGDLMGARTNRRKLREWVAGSLASNYEQLGNIELEIAKSVPWARGWYRHGLDTLGKMEKWGASIRTGAPERRSLQPLLRTATRC
jgi:hypothetical protein